MMILVRKFTVEHIICSLNSLRRIWNIYHWKNFLYMVILIHVMPCIFYHAWIIYYFVAYIMIYTSQLLSFFIWLVNKNVFFWRQRFSAESYHKFLAIASVTLQLLIIPLSLFWLIKLWDRTIIHNSILCWWALQTSSHCSHRCASSHSVMLQFFLPLRILLALSLLYLQVL